VTSPEDRQPFDETAVTRSRRRCFFCETDKSDEWRFLARLNAFVCRTCQEQIEKAAAEEEKTG
jgi:aspartyl/asparaginyl beta-hydroxylase (cupin superfamily)